MVRKGSIRKTVVKTMQKKIKKSHAIISPSPLKEQITNNKMDEQLLKKLCGNYGVKTTVKK